MSGSSEAIASPFIHALLEQARKQKLKDSGRPRWLVDDVRNILTLPSTLSEVCVLVEGTEPSVSKLIKRLLACGDAVVHSEIEVAGGQNNNRMYKVKTYELTKQGWENLEKAGGPWKLPELE